MPFIESTVSEKYFEKELVSLLGWEEVSRFMHVAYTEKQPYMVCGSLHTIFKSPQGDLFGIARATDTYETSFTYHEDIYQECKDRYLGDRRLVTFYLYTLEELHHPINTSTSTKTKGSPFRESLSIERGNPNSQQSPLVKIDLRKKDDNEKFFEEQKYSNWWEDSRVRVKGFVDNRMAFLTIQSDNAPNWNDNNVPRIPFFIGRINSFYADNGDNVAIFAGSYGDFNSDHYKGVLPMDKNYAFNPGNGVSDVIVRRTKYGSRYQSHHLAWNQTPDSMSPVLEGYPRSWGDQKYQFNPSLYSDEILSSEVYVVHPEDGVYGTIPNIILTNQLSILDGEILEIEGCDVLESYRFTPIDSPSPFTFKGNNVHAGLAIKYKE